MRKYLLFFFVFFNVNAAFSQDFSNKGKEFWLAYSYHVGMVNSGGAPAMTLNITSDVTTTYRVEIYGGAVISTGTITANAVTNVTIPNTYFINADGVFNGKAIHVTAVQPIVVYSFITRSAASAATLCLPTNVLGKQYYGMSFTQASNEANASSYITIVGVEDNTSVEIIPTAATKGGWAANSLHTITLNKGQVYQVLGTTTGNNGVDLSGTSIRSIASGTGGCKRIAVFSGSGKLALGCAGGSADNLYQQLYPVASWGRKFLTVPSYSRPNNFYRIMRSDPLANVTLNGNLIPAGAFTFGYYQFSNSIPNSIVSDLPISVTQYFTSQNCLSNGIPYDPDMIVLNPTEQNISKVTLVSSNLLAPPSGSPSIPHQHHLHIIIKNAGTAISSFKFDGSLTLPIGTAWVAHPADPTYSYLYLPNVSETSHSLASDSGFNALSYGYASAETYGYSAGTNVKDLYQQIGVTTQYGIETSPSVCSGSPFKFKISLPYEPSQLVWNLNSLPSTTIPYITSVTQLPSPTCPTTTTSVCYDSTTFVNGKQIWWYSLPTPYSIPTIGTYPITITAQTSGSDGCGSEQEVNFDLEVSAPPNAGFTFTTPGCPAEPVQFNDATITIKPNYSWYWDFGDGSPILSGTNSAIKNPVHTYATAGTYTVRFASITTPGCLSDTLSHDVVVPAMPAGIISGTISVCQNSPFPNISFTGTGGAAPYTFTYHINGGPSQTISSTDPPLTVNTSIPGTFTYYLDSIKNTGSVYCRTEIIGQSATVTVNPLPIASISGTSTVCQNTSALITFTGANGTIPYTFNYTIDGIAQPSVSTAGISSGVTVPVSTATVGSYIYALTGVTDGSSTACSNTASGSATVTVNQLPTATITGTTAVCQNSSGPFISFTGAGGAAPYTFTYNINGGSPQTVTTIVGNSISIPVPTTTPGTFIYNLIKAEESSLGCFQNQTGSATITIHPKPTASFTTVGPYCSGLAVTFTPAFDITPTGNVVSWIWDYGDGFGPQVRTDGNPFTVTYATPGIKNVTFKTISDKGCESDVFPMQITINSKPIAGFINPASCLADAQAQFTDTSSVLGGTIVYWEWDFGDGSPIYAGNTPAHQNPSHAYAAVGQKTVQLIVTTNNGCKDTVVQSFFINGEVTRAAFTTLNPTTLCSNRPVQIQENSIVNVGGLIRTDVYWDYLGAPTAFDQDNNPTPNKIYTHNYPNLQTDQTYSVRYFAYSGFNGVCQKDTIINITVRASPVAQFISVPDVCLNGGTVVLSQGSASGGTGVYMGPGVTFSGGVYTFDPLATGVVLGTNNSVVYTVTSPAGCDSAKVQQIKVLAPPVVNSFAPVGNTCNNNSITFHNTYTNGDGTVIKWIYDWNDASPIQTMTTGADVTHIYTTSGPHTATLTLETGYGCRNIPFPATFTVNPLPAPTYDPSPSVCLPAATVVFTNTTANQSDNTYLWSFELPSASPANTSTLTTGPTHTYTSQGPFSTNLVATNIVTGCVGTSATVVINSNIIHPEPVLQFSNIADVCLNNGTVSFAALASETSGMPGGPGIFTSAIPGAITANGTFNPLIAGVGTHTITYTWTSGFNCPSSIPQTVKVLAPPAVNTFTTIGNRCETQSVIFQNTVTQGAGIINTWIYDWGDGSPVTTANNGNNITHTYVLPGTYPATLTLVTDYGCKSAPAFPLSVVVNALPKPDFTFTPSACLPQAKIDFLNITPPNLSDWYYKWYFVQTPINAADSSIAVSPSHIYTAIGPHAVTLIATSSATGCTDTLIKTVNTIHKAPLASFDFNKLSICTAQNVTVLQNSIPQEGTLTAWSWDYGDNSNAMGQSPPAHTYIDSGTYNVRLTVTNSLGCTDDSIRKFTVYPYPTADAGPTQFILEGGSAILQATATGKDLSYLWTANTSVKHLSSDIILQPVSTPVTDVIYTLTVTARGACAASDTVFVKVLKFPTIPNTFTPNNDGIHDFWEIKYLNSYPQNKVQVFTKEGKLVYESKGYGKPWDGNMNGKSLPVDTYYYIIEPGSGRKPITGFVTIIK